MQHLDQGQLLASIAATSGDCIISLDTDGEILWASPATSDVLGWRPEELAGNDVAVITTRQGGELRAEYLQRLLDGETVGPFVDEGVRRDGSTFKAAVTLGPAADADGRVTGVTVILRDVTAELAEQRQLAQALERSRAHFDQLPMPQAVVGLEGRVQSVNPAWRELFGVPEQDRALVGSDLLTLVPPLDVRDTAAGFAALQEGARESLSYQGVVRDAEERDVALLVDATLLRQGDGTPYALGVSARELTVFEEARRAVEVQRSLYDALGLRAWDTAVVTDADLTITYVSPSVVRMLGYDPSDVVAHKAWEYLHPTEVERVGEVLSRVASTPRHTERVVVRIADKQDRWHWVEASVTNCLDDPQITGLVGNLRDVTEQVQTEEALRLSEALHRAMVETAQEGLMATAPDGTTVFANETVAQVLGVPQSELYGVDPLGLLGLECWRTETADPTRGEVEYTRPDGGRLTLEVSRTRLPDHGVGQLGSLLMVSDVTEARRVEGELRHQALHDPLTGLPNRYLFLDRLSMAEARQQRLDQDGVRGTAVLFLDLDGFKPVNDGHGHGTGDLLLQGIAERLGENVRSTDTVGRLGGDEFAIICEETDEQAAVLVAARILGAVRRPFEIEGGEVSVSLSIGVAVCPPHEFGDLLDRADRAMYRAKQLGGGRVAVARPDDLVTG